MSEQKLSTTTSHVIANSSVISFNREPIQITFKPEGNPPVPDQTELTLKFSFHDDPTNQELRMETNLEGANNLEFKLYNFNSSIDAGNLAPLVIGSINNKQLFLNYRVRKIGDSWTLDYSIYQSK